MDIQHMREYIILARQLNFTSAARELNITQPALSNHLRVLERELGVTLVERSSNKTSRLTAAGHYFLDMADGIVSKYDRMLPKLKELSMSMQGKIMLQLPLDVYTHPLTDYVVEFRHNHPNIDIVLLPWSPMDNIEVLTRGIADCSVVGTVNPQSGFEERYDNVGFVPFTRVEVLLWVDGEHELAKKETLVSDDLKGCNFVACSGLKYDTWMACYRGMLSYFGFESAVLEKSSDSLEDFFLSRVGRKDLLLCIENLADYPTVQMREDRVLKRFHPPMYVPFYLGYRKNAHNPALDLLVSFLASKYDEQAEAGVPYAR